jgi:polar amino acid transport system substrate-binding protein
VIWNGYSITKDRIGKVYFTKPYLRNSQELVVKANSPITSMAQLKGKTLGVQSESAAEDAVNANTSFKDSLKQVRTYQTYQEALTDLRASNRIDAVAVDKILINYIMKKQPGQFRVLPQTLGDEYFGIGVRLNDKQLADQIDDALDQLQKNGTIDKISTKWFGSNIVISDVPRLTAADFK